MLFENHRRTYKSQNLIEDFDLTKRAPKRESKLQQFQIPNPIANTNPGFIPSIPTAIKNELWNVKYLTYSNVNNLGNTENTGPFTTNQRNSRFSKRLMAMQKALQTQSLKLQSLKAQNMDGTAKQDVFSCFGQNQQNFLSMMDQQKNSLDVEYMMGEVEDETGESGVDFQVCGQENENISIEFCSEQNLRPEINYEEYQSYFDV